MVQHIGWTFGLDDGQWMDVVCGHLLVRLGAIPRCVFYEYVLNSSKIGSTIILMVFEIELDVESTRVRTSNF